MYQTLIKIDGQVVLKYRNELAIPTRRLTFSKSPHYSMGIGGISFATSNPAFG